MAGMRTMLSCLIFVSLLGLSVSMDERPVDLASRSSACESSQSCTASPEKGEKVRSLVQLSQQYKAVQEHAREILAQPGAAKPVQPVMAVSKDAPRVAPQRAITFITIYDELFERNLATSGLWLDRVNLPHQWILINNTLNEPITKLYAQAQAQAQHDLMVFLHPDVALPSLFYARFMEKLRNIEEEDPNWGVLGTAGTKTGSEYEVTTSITDIYGRTWRTGEDSTPVQALDEALVVLRRGSPTWDAGMPGFDLYGLDIILAAKQMGQKAYLLNVPIFHKMWDAEGRPYSTFDFEKKVKSPAYQQRVAMSARWFQNKWCSSGYLPVQGCAFYIDCNKFETH